jgi:hypothetical protein
MKLSRRNVLLASGALTLPPLQQRELEAAVVTAQDAWPHGQLEIETGLPQVDRACQLAVRTLLMNVSEKWGTICPVAAPAWSRHYPAWIHPFDNFWMNQVTPYIHKKESVEWPVKLFSMYQRPTGMIGWGVHDTPPADVVQAGFRKDPAAAEKESAGNRYLRDHLYIMQVCDLWGFFGDNRFAESLFDSCTRAFEYLYKYKDLDGDGLVEAAAALDDVDLGEGVDRTGANAVEKSVDQTLLYGALTKYAAMAEALGKTAEARKARERAQTLKKRFNELFWIEKGYYCFAINAKTHEPVLKDHATTHANGYAILWGLAPAERVPKMLEYFTSFDFAVPGPVFLPPVDAKGSNGGRTLNNSKGVYANGGCGWARGHMPSFCLSLYRNGNPKLATDYIERLAKAAVQGGSFREYWTWEKYTGKTVPSGSVEYSETTSGFLDGVLHGYFGVSRLAPGWTKLRLAPQPGNVERCSFTLPLPGGDLKAVFQQSAGKWRAELRSKAKRTIEVRLPDGRTSTVVVQDDAATTV